MELLPCVLLFLHSFRAVLATALPSRGVARSSLRFLVSAVLVTLFSLRAALVTGTTLFLRSRQGHLRWTQMRIIVPRVEGRSCTPHNTADLAICITLQIPDLWTAVRLDWTHKRHVLLVGDSARRPR